MNKARVLLVATSGAAHGYADGLRSSGFIATCATSMGEAVRQLVADPPDVVLAMSDAGAAVQLCEVLSAIGQQPLLLAGQGLPSAVATACLDEGADAIVTLPLPVRELAARIRAVQRRVAGQTPADAVRPIVAGDVVLDFNFRAVWRRGVLVDLSPTEFRLLQALIESNGRVVTNRELLTRVWSEEYVDDLHYVRLYVGYLRAKLEDDPAHPALILNQWGVGYRLATSPH